jgi:hypothetical protein
VRKECGLVDGKITRGSTNKEIDLMQSAKMIYPDKKLAGTILGKVKKRYPNDEWSVMVVPTGFQVTRKPKPLFGGYSASSKPLAGSAKPHVPVGSVVTVTLPYSNQSPHFIECFHGAKKIWVGKTMLIGFNVDKVSNAVVMKMPVKYANKRGFM